MIGDPLADLIVSIYVIGFSFLAISFFEAMKEGGFGDGKTAVPAAAFSIFFAFIWPILIPVVPRMIRDFRGNGEQPEPKLVRVRSDDLDLILNRGDMGNSNGYAAWKEACERLRKAVPEHKTKRLRRGQ